MSPFRLEFLKRGHLENRLYTTLHFKKTYSPSVKTSDWENYALSEPRDNNPYCSEKYDLHLSHYRRFGNEKNFKLISETHESLNQIYSKNKNLNVSPNRKVVNFYTFDDDLDCNFDKLKNVTCRKVCADNFLTTMQHSFRPPQPYKIERLTMTTTPYFENRRLMQGNPQNKFIDDDFACHTIQLQKHKVHKHNSYNPGTGSYTIRELPDKKK